MSDSEEGGGGPSPLPSPIFARCSPGRGTVATRCREFFLRRLQRTADMQKRWSVCEAEGFPGVVDSEQGFPKGEASMQKRWSVCQMPHQEVMDSKQGFPCNQDPKQGFAKEASMQKRWSICEMSHQDSKQGFHSHQDSKQGFPSDQDSKQGFPSDQDSKQGFPSDQDSKQGFPSDQDSKQGFPSDQDSKQGFPSDQDSKQGFLSDQDSKQGFLSDQDSKQGFHSHQDSKQGFPDVGDVPKEEGFSFPHQEDLDSEQQGFPSQGDDSKMQKRWSMCEMQDSKQGLPVGDDAKMHHDSKQGLPLTDLLPKEVQQKRWSICEMSHQDSKQGFPSTEVDLLPKEVQRSICDEVPHRREEVDSRQGFPVVPQELGFPLRKCRSSFDVAMDSLRKEISSLIAKDNALFRQLLSLHDSIAELRERQRHHINYPDDEEEEEDEEDELVDEECHHHRLINMDSSSPDSTLSSSRSSTSLSSCKSSRFSKKKKTKKDIGGRPLVFVDKSDICFRCRKMAPPYRRSSSIGSLYYLQEMTDMESYDSGIHLHHHGSQHSDSDHEIFV